MLRNLTRVKTIGSLIFLVLFAALSCKKAKPGIDLFSVSGFVPAMAAAGDTLTIYGTGFSTDVTSNQVSVNGALARVIEAENGRLKVIVPETVKRGKVAVQLGTAAAESSDPFSCVVRLPATIAQSSTLTAERLYLITGKVEVASGATLTIEPGTIIFGEYFTNAQLVVNDGATLIAAGKPDRPIVFTSSQPPNQRTPGDWRGVELKGTSQRASDQINYTRIEYAGSHPASKPFGALTVQRRLGIGQLEHVQVSYSESDGFRFLGASNDKCYLKNLIAFGCAGNDFSFYGNLAADGQFLLGLKDPLIADPLSADGLLVQSESPVILSNLTLMGGNGVARKKIILAPKLYFPNANSGRGVHIGGRSQGDVTSHAGNCFLFNSLIAGSFRAGISLDGVEALLRFNNNSGAIFQNNFVTSTTSTHTVPVGNPSISPGKVPFFGTLFCSENVNAEGAGFGHLSLSSRSLFASKANDTTKKLDLVLNQGQVYPADDLNLNNLADYRFINSPRVNPAAGSALFGFARFTDDALTADTFFQPVSFCGAFGAEPATDWTKSWSQFDPGKASYN